MLQQQQQQQQQPNWDYSKWPSWNSYTYIHAVNFNILKVVTRTRHTIWLQTADPFGITATCTYCTCCRVSQFLFSRLKRLIRRYIFSYKQYNLCFMSFVVVFHSSFARETSAPFCDLGLCVHCDTWWSQIKIIAIVMIASPWSSSTSCARHDDHSHVTCRPTVCCTPRQYSESDDSRTESSRTVYTRGWIVVHIVPHPLSEQI